MDELLEVVESDWVSVHAVALRVLPAMVGERINHGATPGDIVAEAYHVAETFVNERARRQKREYEAEESPGEPGQKTEPPADVPVVLIEVDDDIPY